MRRLFHSRAWYKFSRSRLSVFGLLTILAIALATIVAPLIAPYPEHVGIFVDFRNTEQPPGWLYFFGTDDNGRDIFSRVLYAYRYCRAGARARHRRHDRTDARRCPHSARGRFWFSRAERYAGLHHKERFRLAKGETVGLGGALRRGGERRSAGVLGPGEPEGRARAWTQGTAAGRQGEEARPLARAGAGSHGGGPERDDGQRVRGRCGGARGCPRSTGLRRRRELPTLRRRARGEPRSTQPLDGGTGSGRSAQTVRRQYLPARRGIATRYLDNYLSWFHSSASPPAPTIGPASPPP